MNWCKILILRSLIIWLFLFKRRRLSLYNIPFYFFHADNLEVGRFLIFEIKAHVNDYLTVIRFALIRIAVAAPDALGGIALGSPLIHGSFDAHIIVCWHLRCVSFSTSSIRSSITKNDVEVILYTSLLHRTINMIFSKKWQILAL